MSERGEGERMRRSSGARAARRAAARAGFVALVVLPALLPALAQQEKVIILEHADSLVGKVLEGEQVRELVGHVRFRQGNITVHCDRAIQYPTSRKISLSGNVLVRDDTLTMRGPRGMYYNGERIAEAYDSVRLDDGKTTLTARYGRYYVDERKAYFRGNVLVRDTASTMKADELTYFRQDKHSIADGNVEIRDLHEDITIHGGHFENFQRFSRMTATPRAVQIDTLEGAVDTFVVQSRVMESFRDSVRRLVAIDSVRMWSSTLSGEAGHAVYETDRDSIIMRNNPFVWYEENQVSGDSIFIRMKNRKPETVYVRGDAMAISRADSLYPRRFDQLTGDFITMHFTLGKIQGIEVDRTATSVYHLFEDHRDSLGTVRTPNGMNRTSGDRVVIYFTRGKADRISVVGGVEGRYFPENLVGGKESDYYLPGFNWKEERPGRGVRHQTSMKEPEARRGSFSDE